MDLEQLVIRNATKEDISKIVDIKVSGWKNAYTGIISEDILNNMSVEKETFSYTNKYSLNDVFVAVLNNEIVGFCRVYDYDTPQYDSDIDCEVREIYIRPDIKGKGIGSKLFKYVLDYFKSKNKYKLYLGVFEDNYKSRKFYEKMGGTLWKKDFLKIGETNYPTVSYIYNLRSEN